MRVAGAFNCNPGSDLERQNVSYIINGESVKVLEPPNSAMCWYPNCHTFLSTNISESTLNRIYNKGKENRFSIGLQSSSQNNYACLGTLVFELHVDIPNMTVDGLQPGAGPETGGTMISVNVSKNIPKGSILTCVFDRTSVPTTTLENGTIQCVSPPGHLGVVSFSIGLNMLNSTYLTQSGPIFEYYYSSCLSRVIPTHGSVSGGTKIYLYGNFRKTGDYTCRFTNATNTSEKSVKNSFVIDVPGKYDDGKNTIVCKTPKWPKHGTVYVSVSLNGQQFSKVIPFRYDSFFTLNMMPIVYSIIAVIIIVIISVITIGILHHFRRKGLPSILSTAVGDYKLLNDDYDIHNIMDEITFQECIGRGRSSEVHKAIWRGSVVAVKKFVPNTKVDEKFIRAFEMEVCTMRALRAPNIIQFLGSFYSPPNVGIITEYMANGSMFSVLHNPEIALPWRIVLSMLSDAARGMHYLHTCKPSVLHRDLKSLNLLVDEFLRVKVSDFGLSTVCKDEHDKQGSLARIGESSHFEVGSLCWTAPEVLEGDSFTTKSDVYSFGIILWECATRCEPYDGIPSFKVIYSVCTDSERPKIPLGLPDQYTKLMTICWDQDPEKRPEFVTILEDLKSMENLNWSGQPTTTVDGKIPAEIEKPVVPNNLSLLTSDAGILLTGFSSSSSPSSSFPPMSSSFLISPKI